MMRRRLAGVCVLSSVFSVTMLPNGSSTMKRSRAMESTDEGMVVSRWSRSDLNSSERAGTERQERRGHDRQHDEIGDEPDLRQPDQGAAQAVNAVGQRIEPRGYGQRTRQVVQREE